ncbi:MAG: helix-turn-helix transcriptional regulator [Gemmatimonadaceae bacterium]
MATPTLGPLELSVLLAVLRLGDAAHGLAIRRDVSERTQHDYSVGAVYTTLQRMEAKGLLTSHNTEPLPIRGGRSRRQFTITTSGQRALGEAQRVSRSVWAGVGKTLRPEIA